MTALGKTGRVSIEKPGDLIGRSCAVAKISKRGRWWVTIAEVSECGRFVKVMPPRIDAPFGKPRWVELKDVMWRAKRDHRAIENWLTACRARLSGEA